MTRDLSAERAGVVACVASVSNRVIARELERKQKKKGLNSFPSPSPFPSFLFFFGSCPSFLDEPREETLATQATGVALQATVENKRLRPAERSRVTCGIGLSLY